LRKPGDQMLIIAVQRRNVEDQKGKILIRNGCRDDACIVSTIKPNQYGRKISK
jgi:hypothetical protein